MHWTNYDFGELLVADHHNGETLDIAQVREDLDLDWTLGQSG